MEELAPAKVTVALSTIQYIDSLLEGDREFLTKDEKATKEMAHFVLQTYFQSDESPMQELIHGDLDAGETPETPGEKTEGGPGDGE